MKDFEVNPNLTEIPYLKEDNNSACNSTVDDDYNFTEDQREAAQELQTLYRKLGLEELDDGFEEGFSAYDDPHYDIVGKLKEVNNRFNEDSTPIDSDRLRKVRFKESVVDLVVPISPIRSYYDTYDYLDRDGGEDGEYDTYVDENQTEINNHSPPDYESEYTSFKGEFEANEETGMEPKRSEVEEETAVSESVSSRENIDADSHEEFQDDRNQYESEDENEDSGDEDEDDEKSDEDPEADDDEGENKNESPSKVSSFTLPPEKTLQLVSGESKPISTVITESSFEAKEDEMSTPKGEKVKNPGKTLEVVTKKKSQNQRPSRDPAGPCDNSYSDTKARVGPSTFRVRPASASASQFAVQKQVLRPSSSIVISKNIASGSFRPPKPEKFLPSYKGNCRSKYGVPEELKRELRRLKHLEAIQKRLKEHEINEYQKRKKEEAEMAFNAWLNAKKTNGKIVDRKEDQKGSPNKVSSYAGSEEAVQAWLEQKENQKKNDSFLKQLREIEENESILTTRREQSKRAYRKWLRKKNIQRRQQITFESQLGFTIPTRLTYSLPHAIHQADMLKQTFQAYFGHMTW